MLSFEQIFTIFIALLAIIDPFGNVPVFLALTENTPSNQKRKIAFKSCLYAFLILFIFLFIGRQILDYFGISVSAFQVGGGIIIFLAGLPMLFAQQLGMKSLSSEVEECAEKNDVSLVPLAVPMLAGPGAITTVIVLADQYSFLAGKLIILVCIFIVLIFTFAVFRYAEGIFKLIGQTGVNLLTRIMGLILIVLAVQYILSGIKNFFTN